MNGNAKSKNINHEIIVEISSNMQLTIFGGSYDEKSGTLSIFTKEYPIELYTSLPNKAYPHFGHISLEEGSKAKLTFKMDGIDIDTNPIELDAEADKKIGLLETKIRFIEIILAWVVMWLIIITVILFMWRVGTVWGGQ